MSRNLSNIFEEFKKEIPKTEDKEEITTDKPEQQQTNVQPVKEQNSINYVKETILDKYNKSKNQPTIEETHIRTTFLLERNLAERLNQLTKNQHGMKQQVLNDAVKLIIQALEN